MRGLLFFFVLLLFGWFAFSGFWYNCKIKDRCGENIEPKSIVVPVEKEKKKAIKPEPAKVNTAASNKINRGDAFMQNLSPISVSGYQFKNDNRQGNIYFSTNSQTTANPIIDAVVSPDLKELVNHLKNSPQSNLQITGYYTNKEVATFNGKNLGLDRANNVKNYLVKAGLNEKQIETKSLQNNNLKVINENVVGAINLSLKIATKPKASTVKSIPVEPTAKPTVPIKKATIPIVKPTPKPTKTQTPLVTKAIEQETRTVYFKYNSSEIIITKELEKYVEQLKLYLKQNTNKQVVVTGHTDSLGDRQQNVELALKRANFVKQFLIKKGITAKQINTNSEGPNKPIASNKTAAGREQNRRVEITFN